LCKLFNGTLLAKHDESGTIIKDTVLKFDLRGELGVGVELSRQAVPVVANDCIVRVFYFIRRLAFEIRENEIKSLSEMKHINWNNVNPRHSPTIARMLTIATGVFTTVNVGEAVISQKYWVSINYAGVGRFAVAIGEDVSWCMKSRRVNNIKQIYEDIKKFAYTHEDDNIYGRIGADMNIDKLGLTVEQTELLYNLEYYKTANDIEATKQPINKDGIIRLKQEWIVEWKEYISKGFASFLQVENAELHWFSEQELFDKIEENKPTNTWFRLVLLEAMLFEPYYPLGVEKDKKGNDVPSKKYAGLQVPLCGYSKSVGDSFLDTFFTYAYYAKGYVKRLRKCYDKVVVEMKEVLKGIIIGGAITAGIAIVVIATAGAFAPAIAVALVGSSFAGLSGAALTGACLAYLGGGAVAIGGLGMAGGTAAIVGGGAILGIGAGLGVGGAVGAAGLVGKQNTITQSAKLLVSVREIFLNDEHDTDYSNSVYEQYVQNIMDIEKWLVELKLKADVASSSDKKELKRQIKNAEESVEAMKIARRSLLRFKSSFEEGLAQRGKTS
jgi:virulence-associated protein VapD